MSRTPRQLGMAIYTYKKRIEQLEKHIAELERGNEETYTQLDAHRDRYLNQYLNRKPPINAIALDIDWHGNMPKKR